MVPKPSCRHAPANDDCRTPCRPSDRNTSGACRDQGVVVAVGVENAGVRLAESLQQEAIVVRRRGLDEVTRRGGHEVPGQQQPIRPQRLNHIGHHLPAVGKEVEHQPGVDQVVGVARQWTAERSVR
jgi:hypothetical protein